MFITFEDDKSVDQEEVKPTGESAEIERQERRTLRELDAEIHVKVMGLPSESTLVGDGKTMDTALRVKPDNAAYRVRSDADMYWHRWSPDGAERVVIAPHYSSDIAAAMEVVETMRERGWRVSIMNNPGTVKSDLEWSVDFARSRTVNALAATLPEAICRAALALVDGPQNQETK